MLTVYCIALPLLWKGDEAVVCKRMRISFVCVHFLFLFGRVTEKNVSEIAKNCNFCGGRGGEIQKIKSAGTDTRRWGMLVRV